MGEDKIQIMHCVVKVSSVDIIVTIFDVVAKVIQGIVNARNRNFNFLDKLKCTLKNLLHK